MLLKEYPDIILDTIPKLYEIHSKVFITHLYDVEKQLQRLPLRFCKMYTTSILANQLLKYLIARKANISFRDFHIIEESQPITIRLNDGKRLEIMLCAGNELGNSLMLLVRRLRGGRLLYYYSAVQQDDLCRLMGNTIYQEWIAQGTEVLFLNLQAASQPFVHIDFEEVAKEISEYSKNMNNKAVIKLPLFGYEFLVQRLAKTFALFGHIKLMDSFLDNFLCLTPEPRYFAQPGYIVTAKVFTRNNFEIGSSYPLAKLKWSPVPNRINLITLCSLLRPLHIRGIVSYHEKGNAAPVPEYLKRFKNGYSPKSKEIQGPGHSNAQTEKISPAKSQKDGTTSRKDPFVYSKARKLAFVESEEDMD